MNFKQKINSIFGKLGYKIQKRDKIKPDIHNMWSAIGRCVERGTHVKTVIDVGASNGCWSKRCMDVLADADYLLVEAQDAHKQELQSFKQDQNNVEYVIAAAGEEDGEIYFDDSQLFGGVASIKKLNDNYKKQSVISIDKEIERNNLQGPFLLKLDTHGFEVPILKGAKKCLKDASIVIIETYNFRITDSSLLYFEMCEFMIKLGFRPIDMVDFMLRKYDNSFWQMDTIFIPENSKEFDYNKYN
jgi:FkbM family methyltransferase